VETFEKEYFDRNLEMVEGKDKESHALGEVTPQAGQLYMLP
jgi:hypothetical protein